MCISCCNPFKEAEKAIKKAKKSYRNYQDTQQVQHLIVAITHYHHAYETSNENHSQFPNIIINYAALLSKQDQLSGGKSNLEEVIRLLEEGRVLMEKKYGLLLNNLGQAYLDRYRMSNTSQNLKSAMDAYEQARSQNSSSPVSLAYASSLLGSATTLWTACELQPQGGGDLVRLNQAIGFLKLAQRQNSTNVQMECHMNLASVYDLLYRDIKTTTRDNLDLSISHYSHALNLLHPPSINRAPTLVNLAKQHFERHTLTKDQADWKFAQKYRDEAKTLVDQVPEAEELKKKIEVLTSNMDMYEKRGQTFASVSSKSTSDGMLSPRGTMSLDTITGQAHATDPAEYDVNRRDTFSSISAVASGSRQLTSSSLHEGSYSITGQAHKTEPAQFDSERRDTLASVTEETGMHKNQTSETLSIKPPAPSRKGIGNTGGEKMVQIPGSVLGQPLVTEPGQSARTTPGHHVARDKTGPHG